MVLFYHRGANMKQCCRCKEWRSVEDFGRAKNRSDGLYPQCKECVRESARLWRERNKEYKRAWYEANREKVAEYGRAYYAANKDAVMAAVHRRRARLAAAPGSYTAAEWNDLCDRYGNKCLRCGCAGPLTKDHIVPLSRGGSNDISNLQPLCSTCNKSKGVKSVDYRPQV